MGTEMAVASAEASVGLMASTRAELKVAASVDA